MGLLSLTCPNCGGTLELEDSREEWYCQYCGSKVIREKTLIELSGTVAVDGIATADALLERAYIFIEDQEYGRAGRYLENVLDIDPKNWKAYIGRVLCKTELREISALGGWNTALDEYDDFNKALKYADEENKKMLLSLLESSKTNEEAARKDGSNWKTGTIIAIFVFLVLVALGLIILRF